MDTLKLCPQCGKPVPAGAALGLCPECLLKVGVGSNPPGDPAAPGGPPPAPARFEPPSPEQLAAHFLQLEILGLIGQGGMGAVYKARQKDLDRLVALKILPAGLTGDAAFAARFTREARALARLNHSHVVTVYDFGRAGDFYYFLMEFVDGVNLRELLLARKLTPREALAIVPQICEALQYAHDQGVVHRDIKPENILVDKSGRVKIADFGLARLLVADREGPRLTESRDVMGTPHYMAPEQVEHPREVDHRADIYSLGVVFYEMLTGELPLGKFAPPSRLVQVDVRLDEVVLHALEKKPERRYQQAGEVKTAVETIAATPGQPTTPPPPSPPHPETAGGSGDAGPAPSRFSRLAIAGAVWAPWFFIAGFLMFTATYMVIEVSPHGQQSAPAWPLMFLMIGILGLGLTAPFGTTILGWMAIAQIRRSAGRFHGLALALFDALLYPLLALDGFIGWMVYVAVDALGSQVHPGQLAEPRTGRVVLLTVLISLVVDSVLVWRAWRAVNKPLGGLPPPAGQEEAGKPPRIAPTAGRKGGLNHVLLTVGFHALALLAAFAFFVLVVPRFAAGFQSLQVPLPGATAFTLGFARFLGRWWFLVIPFLLGCDVGFSFLLQLLGGRRLLVLWSGLVVLGLGVVVGLAARTLQLPKTTGRSDATLATPTADGTLRANLPQGEIELLGVSFHPSANQPWWRPDGSPFTGTALYTWDTHSAVDRNHIGREWVLQLRGLPADASSPVFQFDPAASSAGGEAGFSPGQAARELVMRSATFPKAARTATLKVGVGLGAWETLTEKPARGGGTDSLSRPDNHWTISFAQAAELNGAATVTVTHTVTNGDVRVVALDTDGTEHAARLLAGRGVTAFHQLTFVVPGLPLAKARLFRFQVRPYHWVEFRNVALRPREQAAAFRDGVLKPELAETSENESKGKTSSALERRGD